MTFSSFFQSNRLKRRRSLPPYWDPTVRILNQVQFDSWLEANYWLEDAFIDELAPVPSVEGRPAPAEVGLSFRMQIAGGYAAGDVRRMRHLRLTAMGVSEYSIVVATGFAAGHCSQGAEAVDVPGKIGFAFDAPAEVRLVCDAIDVEHHETEEVIEPHYSDRSFYAVASEGTLPTPAEWLRWFRGRGQDVVWRYYASEEVPPCSVPQQNYSGWFLQHRERLNEDPKGLFFFSGRQNEHGFELQISNYTRYTNSRSDQLVLWKIATDYIASLPAVTLRCGNAVLTPNKWLQKRSEIHRSLEGSLEE